MHGDGGTLTPDEVVQRVVEDENDGFDAAWFGQVFNGDSLTLVALAGARTSRIELGTSVIPTYTRHPFAMAQQAMTVQAACGGRFTLGIGPSHGVVVENMWGMSYDRPAVHVREYLSVLLPLVQEGRVAFKGELYSVNAGIGVKGGSPVSVMISALAPVMLRLAGTLTDGTITWMTGPKTIETHVAPSINLAAQEAGRPAPRVVVGLPIAVHDDVAAARELAGKAFAMYGTLPNYRRVLDREGAPGPAEVAIVGDERAVEQQLRDLAAAGATDFLAPVMPVGDDAKGSISRTRELLRGLVGKI
jgi:F420-dependent oxidoreductase-like protein